MRCRVMKVSTSGLLPVAGPASPTRRRRRGHRANTIVDIRNAARRSYGIAASPHASCAGTPEALSHRATIPRLMRQAGVAGIHRRKGRGCTRRDGSDPSDDLVNRAFDPTSPDRLWVMDVTEHPAGDGKVYLAVVLDAFSRRVVGWSIADHLRSELVVDAVQMAIWRRQPPPGQTVAHSDHGARAIHVMGRSDARLRGAGLLGSMGSIGDCFD